ncbi:MAG: SIR2 family protein [Gordonia polyisoprenivorans]|nr:SIR2 family protein [Gordonia polyisoprenivorans]
MESAPLDDVLVPLAFSLHSNRGGYAVIAGAGVSLGAGLPSAWGIMTILANRVRELVDPDSPPLDVDTVESWWVGHYGEDFTYSGLFAKVAQTKLDRESLLREHIETGTGPGAAHHAIAQLVELGVIKIIVTMNFDHLFEDALRARGIEPRVISTDAAAATARPLHSGAPVVVHLHGEYRDADSMLNTADELGDGYGARGHLVAQIVREHGLLVAGWSAESDHSLRDLVVQNHRRYFRPIWISPSDPRPTAAEVIAGIDAQHVPATADEAFGRVADAVVALDRLEQPRHPITAPVISDRIKRDLAGRRPAITAHDTFTQEAANLESHPALVVDDFFGNGGLAYTDRIETIANISQPITAATATLAYWGGDDTDEWWTATLNQWAHRFDANGGNTNLLDLPLTVAVRLYYAAGVSLVAARRFDALVNLFTIETTSANSPTNRPMSAAQLLDWERTHSGLQVQFVRELRATLAADLAASLELSSARIDTAWQEFETIRAAAQILLSNQFTNDRLSDVISARFAWEQRADEEASDARREAYIALDRALGAVARAASSRSPHIRVDRAHGMAGERWNSRVAQHIATDPRVTTALQRLLPDQTWTSADRASAPVVALTGAQSYFQIMANQMERELVPVNSVGFLPNTLWLDQTPSGGQ